jgi:hypothetical protein
MDNITMKRQCLKLFAIPPCPLAQIPLLFLVIFARFYWIFRTPVL